MSRTATVAATEPVAQTVRVVDQMESVEPATIPRSVLDYFEGRGFRLVTGCSLPHEVNRRSRLRSYPLRPEDMTVEADRNKLTKALKDAGFVLKEDNFRRSDTLIYVQSREDYINLGEIAFQRSEQRKPNDDLAAQTIRDAAGDELVGTGLLNVYTRAELTRRTQ